MFKPMKILSLDLFCLFAVPSHKRDHRIPLMKKGKMVQKVYHSLSNFIYIGNINKAPAVKARRRIKYMGIVNFQNSVSL